MSTPSWFRPIFISASSVEGLYLEPLARPWPPDFKFALGRLLGSSNLGTVTVREGDNGYLHVRLRMTEPKPGRNIPSIQVKEAEFVSGEFFTQLEQWISSFRLLDEEEQPKALPYSIDTAIMLEDGYYLEPSSSNQVHQWLRTTRFTIRRLLDDRELGHVNVERSGDDLLRTETFVSGVKSRSTVIYLTDNEFVSGSFSSRLMAVLKRELKEGLDEELMIPSIIMLKNGYYLERTDPPEERLTVKLAKRADVAVRFFLRRLLQAAVVPTTWVETGDMKNTMVLSRTSDGKLARIGRPEWFTLDALGTAEFASWVVAQLETRGPLDESKKEQASEFPSHIMLGDGFYLEADPGQSPPKLHDTWFKLHRLLDNRKLGTIKVRRSHHSLRLEIHIGGVRGLAKVIYIEEDEFLSGSFFTEFRQRTKEWHEDALDEGRSCSIGDRDVI